MAFLISASKITCFCGAVQEPPAILRTKIHPTASCPNRTTFPIPAELCHCDSCRYATGSLFGSFVFLLSPPSQQSLDACREYQSSNCLTRYSCQRCGTQMFLKSTAEGEQWLLCAGTIDVPENGVDGIGETPGSIDALNIFSQSYAGDPLDLGCFGRMLDVAMAEAEQGGQNILTSSWPLQAVFQGRWTGEKMTAEQMLDLRVSRIAAVRGKREETVSRDRILISCKCETIQFYLLEQSSKNGEQLDSELSLRSLRQGGAGYRARACVCRSCRLASGHMAQHWAYVPREAIVKLDNGNPIDFSFGNDDYGIPGLDSYRSSEQVRRAFCSTCSATVFYEHKQRPEVVNVAAGLFRAQTGALAEGWLSWDWRTGSKTVTNSYPVTFMKTMSGDKCGSEV